MKADCIFLIDSSFCFENIPGKTILAGLSWDMAVFDGGAVMDLANGRIGILWPRIGNLAGDLSSKENVFGGKRE